MLAAISAFAPLVGQATWLPTWATPLWILAVGLLLGAVALAAVLAVFAGLSFTPLGKLADSPRKAQVVSLVLGVLFAAGLAALYLPGAGDHRQMLILPLVTFGLAAGFAVVYGVWRRTRSELLDIAKEGAMPWLLGCAGFLTVIGLVATPVTRDPKEILQSLREVNLFSDGTREFLVQLEPAPLELDNPDAAPFQKIDIDYVMFNVAEMTVRSDKTIIIADADTPAGFMMNPVRIDPGEPVRYQREERTPPPLPMDPDSVYMQNREVDPATVQITMVTRPTIPQAASILTTAITFFAVFLGYITLRQAAPRVSAVALATTKSEMAQPLYLLLILIGIAGVLLFSILPFNTLGEDIRMMKDSSVTLIMVLGMLQAVWSAGTSVSEEIEGRTALTVLSKPISRQSFLLGKYVGIMLTVLVLFAILTAVFLPVLSYKPIYDARENSNEVPPWQVPHEEIVTTVPAMTLYFMQTAAIGGVAVALATRLPLLANFVVCFIVYVIGNLTSPIVRSTMGENELVGFVGRFIAVIVPNLNTFNVQSAVDAGNPIPPIYLAGAFTYLMCFGVMILMVALLMFEDRDLA